MNERNFFGELLTILHTEELMRLCRRSQLQHNPRLAEILHDEVEEREGIEEAARSHLS